MRVFEEDLKWNKFSLRLTIFVSLHVILALFSVNKINYASTIFL